MSYPLRLPPELDSEARERCQRLGISLNAFIAIALDAYLRAGDRPDGKRQAASRREPVAGKRPSSEKTKTAAPVGLGRAVEVDSDPRSWRNWHDPEMWPYVDPEFEHRWEGVDVDDDAAAVALELEYWSTRQRPA